MINQKLQTPNNIRNSHREVNPVIEGNYGQKPKGHENLIERKSPKKMKEYIETLNEMDDTFD